MKAATHRTQSKKKSKSSELPIYKERMFVFEAIEYDTKECIATPIYLGQAKSGHHPLSKQNAWINIYRNFQVNNEAYESILKLKQIADENNVCFVDLCSYALKYPSEGNPSRSNPVKFKRAEVYDLKLPIKSLDLAEEISSLADLVFVGKDILSHSSKTFFRAYTTFLILKNFNTEILSELYKDLNKSNMMETHEFCTYDISVKMDCYGAVIPDELYACMSYSRLLEEDLFNKIAEATKLALEEFAKSKATNKNFEILDIKAMKEELKKAL